MASFGKQVFSRMLRHGKLSNTHFNQLWRHKPFRTDNENANLKQTKLIKKVFSTLLFGSTFATVLYAKRRKRNQLSSAYQDCSLLPADTNYANPHMFYNYKGYVLPDFVIREKPEIEKFEARADDIFVVSFPKTGTTWVQEIVYLIDSDLDFQTASDVGLETRFPYLEFIYPGIKDVAKMKSVRHIKSHLPLSLLPPDVHITKPKIVCVMRNPKDVAVSYYHYVQMLTPTSYSGTFQAFLDSFLKDKVMYGPLWKHYLEFWEHRNDENILIVMYEDLHKDMRSEIKRISAFLGKNLSEYEVDQICAHCSFQSMAENPSVNYKHWDDLGLRNKSAAPFMRKGQIGDWKNYFTPDMNESFNQWECNRFHNTGLKFIYSLEDTTTT